jgi:hypothetical protein
MFVDFLVFNFHLPNQIVIVFKFIYIQPYFFIIYIYTYFEIYSIVFILKCNNYLEYICNIFLSNFSYSLNLVLVMGMSCKCIVSVFSYCVPLK